jgi:hypothetical protein
MDVRHVLSVFYEVDGNRTMKNQLDMIISGVVLFIAISMAVVFYSTEREPVKPPDVPKASLGPITLPNPQPDMTNGMGK